MWKQEIENIKTGKIYHMVKAGDIEPTAEQHHNIKKICNEPLVFKLFVGLKEYPLEKAQSFLQGACQGWQDDSFFIFVVIDPESGLIVAAIDIKSKDSDAEIGYWCSKNHSGLMANTVSKLKAIAKEKGYRSLYGKPINERSERVLQRNNFVLRAGSTEKIYDFVLASN